MLSVVLLCLTVPMVLVVVAMQGTHCAKITHSLSLDLPDSPQPSPPSVGAGAEFAPVLAFFLQFGTLADFSSDLSPNPK